MKSRASFCNGTVIRKDVTRFAPVWIIYSITLLLSFLGLAAGKAYETNPLYTSVLSDILLKATTNLYYAPFVAVMLFSDLFKSRRSYALHAMPLRRECWFFSHTIAGLAFSFVPNLVYAAATAILLEAQWYYAFIWLLFVSLQYLFFFGVALFSIHCCGKNAGVWVVYILINFFSMGVWALAETFLSPLLPGIVIREDPFLLFSPYAQISSNPVFEVIYYVEAKETYTLKLMSMTCGIPYMLIVAAVGVGLGALALLMYRRRDLESTELISDKKIRPFFVLVFTLAVAMLFHSLFGGNLYTLPISLAIGYFSCHMLMQRKFNVFTKKLWRNFCIMGMVIAALLAVAGMDLFGWVLWQPKPEQVSAVQVSDYDYYYSYNGHRVTEPKAVQKVIDLHHAVVEASVVNGDQYDDWDAVYIYFKYEMENGTEIHRRYALDPNSEIARQVNEYFSTPQYMLDYEDWDSYLDRVEFVEIFDHTIRGEYARGLMDAIRTDCDLGRMNPYYNDQDVASVFIQLDDDYDYIVIYDSCKATIAWLDANIPGWNQ